jgi:hypothetical protein
MSDKLTRIAIVNSDKVSPSEYSKNTPRFNPAMNEEKKRKNSDSTFSVALVNVARSARRLAPSSVAASSALK